MILGKCCTRRCRFCCVQPARPDPPKPAEPQRLAEAVRRLQLKQQLPSATIEILPDDFHARPDCIATVCQANPDVFNHNLETVERLTPEVRPQADYHRSLKTLRLVRDYAPAMPTKSGLMVGLGETMDEICQALADLRKVDCNIVTVGQYLSPTPQHYPVQYFWTPEEFETIADHARNMGFAAVAAGPFVRSSYNAGKIYDQMRQQRQQG